MTACGYLQHRPSLLWLCLTHVYIWPFHNALMRISSSYIMDARTALIGFSCDVSNAFLFVGTVMRCLSCVAKPAALKLKKKKKKQWCSLGGIAKTVGIPLWPTTLVIFDIGDLYVYNSCNCFALPVSGSGYQPCFVVPGSAHRGRSSPPDTSDPDCISWI